MSKRRGAGTGWLSEIGRAIPAAPAASPTGGHRGTADSVPALPMCTMVSRLQYLVLWAVLLEA